MIVETRQLLAQFFGFKGPTDRVTFSLNDEPGAAKMYKDENVALARAVVDALP